MTASEKLHSIQVLRAFAALYVVLLHSFTYATVGFTDADAVTPLRYVALTGNSGVDLFFVISGFVMFHNHRSDFQRLTPSAFLAKRAARILPLYWLLTLLVALALVATPHLFTVPRTITPSWLAESLFFLPTSKPLPIVTLGWTLNFEAYFYIAFATALLLPRMAAVGMLAGFFLLSALVGLTLPGSTPMLDIATSGLLLEFLAGILVAVFWRAGARGKSTVWPTLGLAIGMIVICAGAAHGRRDDSFERLFAWGLPYALILNGAVRLRIQWPRFLSKLGDASYSIYLVQVFTLPVSAAIMHTFFYPFPLEARVAITFLLSVGTGWACWMAVERPLLRAVGTWADQAAQSMAARNKPAAAVD